MLDGQLSACIDLVELRIWPSTYGVEDLTARDDGSSLQVDREVVGLVDKPRRKLLQRIERVHGELDRCELLVTATIDSRLLVQPLELEGVVESLTCPNRSNFCVR
jgi:hypothetical protein